MMLRDAPLRGWRNTAEDLIGFLLAQTNLSQASVYQYTREAQRVFIEFKPSNNTISRAFRKPLIHDRADFYTVKAILLHS